MILASTLSLGYYTGLDLPKSPRDVAEVKESYVKAGEYVRASAGGDEKMVKVLLFGLLGATAGGGVGCCFDLMTGCIPLGTCGGACVGGLMGGVAGYVF